MSTLDLELTDWLLARRPEVASDLDQQSEVCATLAGVLGCVIASFDYDDAEAILERMARYMRDMAAQTSADMDSRVAFIAHAPGHA